jgi:hypothetical protein
VSDELRFGPRVSIEDGEGKVLGYGRFVPKGGMYVAPGATAEVEFKVEHVDMPGHPSGKLPPGEQL